MSPELTYSRHCHGSGEFLGIGPLLGTELEGDHRAVVRVLLALESPHHVYRHRGGQHTGGLAAGQVPLIHSQVTGRDKPVYQERGLS